MEEFFGAREIIRVVEVMAPVGDVLVAVHSRDEQRLMMQELAVHAGGATLQHRDIAVLGVEVHEQRGHKGHHAHGEHGHEHAQEREGQHTFLGLRKGHKTEQTDNGKKKERVREVSERAHGVFLSDEATGYGYVILQTELDTHPNLEKGQP